MVWLRAHTWCGRGCVQGVAEDACMVWSRARTWCGPGQVHGVVKGAYMVWPRARTRCGQGILLFHFFAIPFPIPFLLHPCQLHFPSIIPSFLVYLSFIPNFNQLRPFSFDNSKNRYQKQSFVKKRVIFSSFLFFFLLSFFFFFFYFQFSGEVFGIKLQNKLFKEKNLFRCILSFLKTRPTPISRVRDLHLE